MHDHVNERVRTDAVNAGGQRLDGAADQDSWEVCTDVVVAVADAVGVDPLDLDEQLHDCVDPDALESVIQSIDAGHVEFEMGNRRVLVQANGAVFVSSGR